MELVHTHVTGMVLVAIAVIVLAMSLRQRRIG